MRRSKILCTLGPSSGNLPMLRQMVAAGLDAVRLNFSHGTLADHRQNVALVRQVAAETGRPLSIVQDLQGPKIRVGALGPAGRVLTTGDEVLLTTLQSGGPPDAIPVSYPELPQDLRLGDPLLLDDGLLRLSALEKVDSTLLRCRVEVGGHLSSHKGINLPGVPLSTPALTRKDREDLAAGLELGVDWVALSFVRRAEEVRELRQLIEKSGKSTQIIAKIEKPEALEQLSEIIEAADGIMVARGDLGVEVPPQRVPLLQQRIVAETNAAGKLVIIATQMLDSMVRNPRPTRAEVTDVAWAVMQGADATMLSNETAIGAYAVEAVAMMATIVEEIEDEQQTRGALRNLPAHGSIKQTDQAIGHVAAQAASVLDAACIACFTGSGRTAGLVSDFRPHQPILAFTFRTEVFRRLGLIWGVTPILLEPGPLDLERAGRLVQEHATRLGLARTGQTLVITMGQPSHVGQPTNLLWVRRID